MLLKKIYTEMLVAVHFYYEFVRVEHITSSGSIYIFICIINMHCLQFVTHPVRKIVTDYSVV